MRQDIVPGVVVLYDFDHFLSLAHCVYICMTIMSVAKTGFSFIIPRSYSLSTLWRIYYRKILFFIYLREQMIQHPEKNLSLVSAFGLVRDNQRLIYIDTRYRQRRSAPLQSINTSIQHSTLSLTLSKLELLRIISQCLESMSLTISLVELQKRPTIYLLVSTVFSLPIKPRLIICMLENRELFWVKGVTCQLLHLFPLVPNIFVPNE